MEHRPGLNKQSRRDPLGSSNNAFAREHPHHVYSVESDLEPTFNTTQTNHFLMQRNKVLLTELEDLKYTHEDLKRKHQDQLKQLNQLSHEIESLRHTKDALTQENVTLHRQLAGRDLSLLSYRPVLPGSGQQPRSFPSVARPGNSGETLDGTQFSHQAVQSFPRDERKEEMKKHILKQSRIIKELKRIVESTRPPVKPEMKTNPAQPQVLDTVTSDVGIDPYQMPMVVSPVAPEPLTGPPSQPASSFGIGNLSMGPTNSFPSPRPPPPQDPVVFPTLDDGFPDHVVRLPDEDMVYENVEPRIVAQIVPNPPRPGMASPPNSPGAMVNRRRELADRIDSIRLMSVPPKSPRRQPVESLDDSLMDGEDKMVYPSDEQPALANDESPESQRTPTRFRVCPTCEEQFNVTTSKLADRFQQHCLDCVETLSDTGFDCDMTPTVSDIERDPCPFCQAHFPSTVPQIDYERHVLDHCTDDSEGGAMEAGPSRIGMQPPDAGSGGS